MHNVSCMPGLFSSYLSVFISFLLLVKISVELPIAGISLLVLQELAEDCNVSCMQGF
jgi:hypothetical protein